MILSVYYTVKIKPKMIKTTDPKNRENIDVYSIKTHIIKFRDRIF